MQFNQLNAHITFHSIFSFFHSTKHAHKRRHSRHALNIHGGSSNMNVISGDTGLDFQGLENFSQSASYWDPTWTHFAHFVLHVVVFLPSLFSLIWSRRGSVENKKKDVTYSWCQEFCNIWLKMWRLPCGCFRYVASTSQSIKWNQLKIYLRMFMFLNSIL